MGTTKAIEPGLRVYAIGDIHGRLDLLLRLETLIAEDLATSEPQSSLLVFLGDYVDRGPESRGVIEYLSNEIRIGDVQVFLRGNHEEVLLAFLSDASVLAEWSQFGGLETLYSYGVRPRLPLRPSDFGEFQERLNNALPVAHRNFLQNTRYSFDMNTHYFVHAGVRPGIRLANQKPEDLLWIRDDFLNSSRPANRVIVHGHTPVVSAELLPHRINVDTGAYLSGRLTCVVLEGSTRRIISS